MNKEEIDYWLRYFSNHNHGFMSEDGKKITLFKVFQELKELEVYKYNMDRDYLRLEKENQELKEKVKNMENLQNRIDKALDFINCHFKEMVADEEAQELKDILKESGD